MKLYSLIKNLNCRVFGNTVVDIKGLYHNDVLVREGGLFFCLRGTKIDGTDFVKSAIKNGAVAIVSEQEVPFVFGVTQVIVKNAREAMSLIASRFYGNAAGKLKLIGVTGTNGKTTVSSLIYNSLKEMNVKAAVIGTNGLVCENLKIDTGFTTPDPIELHKYFAMLAKRGVEYVCMEVSAHAIDLHKIDGLKFEVVVFTNLTEDHLDYFKTMQKYFEAKTKLFSQNFAKVALINVDDEFGSILFGGITLPKFAYAINRKADFFAGEIKTSKTGQEFAVGSEKFSTSLFGRFNLYNILACYGVLKILKFSNKIITNAISNLKPVDGRFNVYKISGRTYVVDYAHTPDGLKNILEAAKEMVFGGKLICVFGCGGNREVQKRSIMGEISSKIADFCIITSDNPRFEKREDIISDIASGIKSKNFLIVSDRKEAIKKSFEISDVNDVVVVAGKGVENYIDEKGVKIPYSDTVEILKLGEVDE